MFRKRPDPPALRLEVTIVIERDDDGSFHAYCPAFEGLHVDGRTEEESVANASDALYLYLSSLVRHGDPLPVGPHCTVEKFEPYHVPVGAFLRHVELQWPSHQTSGIS